MDIKTLLEIQPRKLPPTPYAVTQYLMMDEKGRFDFNKSNPGVWGSYDNSTSTPKGFFSELREALGFNSEWAKILKEEIKRPENINHAPDIMRKVREFYKELYVGPMIGALPFFAQWVLPEQQEDVATSRVEDVSWEE